MLVNVFSGKKVLFSSTMSFLVGRDLYFWLPLTRRRGGGGPFSADSGW